MFETHEIAVCVDCLMLMANGTMGDVTETEEADHVAAMDHEWPMADGWQLVPGSEELGFSWSGCEGCGSTLGGDRHEAVAMRPATALPAPPAPTPGPAPRSLARRVLVGTAALWAVLVTVFILSALAVGIVRGPAHKAPAASAPVETTTTTAPARIEEDSPGWDCATMGNRVCGPGAVPLSTYCQDEPSATPEGVERIAYLPGQTVTVAGLPVSSAVTIAGDAIPCQ